MNKNTTQNPDEYGAASEDRRQEMLFDAVRDINAVLDDGSIMHALAVHAVKLTGAAAGAWGTVQDGNVVFREYCRAGECVPIHYVFAAGEGVPGRVMADRKRYSSVDAAHDAQVSPEMRRQLGFSRLIDVPIPAATGTVLGCLELYDRKDGRDFDERDARLLEGLASAAGAALKNAGEVSGLRHTESKVRDSERSFIDIFQATPVVMVISRQKDGRYLEVNRAFELAAGYSRSEVIGKTSAEIGIFPYPGQREALLGELSRKGGVYGRELVFRGKGGREIIGLTSVIPFIFRQQPCFLFVGVDISGRKEAEDALRGKEEAFRTLAENSPDIIVRYDPDCRFLYVNPQGTSIFGRPRSEIIGKRNIEIGMPKAGSDFWEALVREITETKKGKTIEFEFPPLKLYFNSRLVPEFDDHRNVISVMSISRDITQLKTTERQLSAAVKESQRRAAEAEEERRTIRAIVSNIPEAIFIADPPDARIRMASSYVAELTGLPVEDMTGRLPGEISGRIGLTAMPMLRGESREYPISRALKYGEIVTNEEWRFRRTDGAIRTILINARPIRDRNGVIAGSVSAWRDISERKRAEDILRRNEYELRTLVDNSPDLIVRFDRSLRYVYVNPAYERISGLPREQLFGKTNRELGMPGDQLQYWETAARKVFENGREEAVEFQLTGFFGKRYFWGRIIPEFARDGSVESVMTISRDVTERHRAEERIRYISFHDEVTGLFNRAYFEEELRRLDTERELPVSIIIGDVNKLKLANDVFGHQEGDRLLKTIGEILHRACRKNDIIARWGGDEFAVILPRTDAATALEVNDRIKRTTRETRGTVIDPSIALGAATKGNPDQSIYRAVRRAEQEMYENKTAESRENTQRIVASLRTLLRERTGGLDSHIQRSDVLADRFAEALGLAESQRRDLHLLAGFHDIGKAVMSRDLLTKHGPLTPQEWAAVKKHAETGFGIVKSLEETSRISDEVLSHEEHWDGTGYPRGLKGREIPFLSRVLAILDAYDVMTHERPYAKAFTPEEAVSELSRDAGRRYDPQLVDIFIRAVVRRVPEASKV